jgi:hypothetical protein
MPSSLAALRASNAWLATWKPVRNERNCIRVFLCFFNSVFEGCSGFSGVFIEAFDQLAEIIDRSQAHLAGSVFKAPLSEFATALIVLIIEGLAEANTPSTVDFGVADFFGFRKWTFSVARKFNPRRDAEITYEYLLNAIVARASLIFSSAPLSSS